MGSFAALLGHSAAGFEQARQEDVQRQFTDEQNRRSMAAELLGKVALDPNQPDEVRTPFTEAYMNLAQLPPDKKFDFKKHMAPAFDALAQYRQKQQTAAAQPAAPAPSMPGVQLPTGGPPPPPPSMSMQSDGTHAQTLPSGVAGPPQQVANAPQIQSSGVPRPLAFPEPSVQGPSAPPAPPTSFLAGAHQIAQNQGYAAQQQAYGTQIGDIAAMQQTAQAALNNPQLAPLIKADPLLSSIITARASGVQLPATIYGMANRSSGKGSDIPGSDLIAEGVTKTNDGIAIDPAKFYNENQRMGLPSTYTQTKGPGQVAGVGGGLTSPLQLESQKLAVRFPYQMKILGQRFQNSIALQNNAFTLGLQRHDYGLTDGLTAKAFQDLAQRQGALSIMQQNYKDALNGNQQAQVSMLFNHIGMTSGAVPGSRQSRANIEEAEESTPWLKEKIAKWFHQDENGDYVFDGLKGGINLNKAQMEQMIDLAKQRVGVQQQLYEGYKNAPFTGALEFPGMQSIGVTPTRGGGAAAKPTGEGPPKPPKSAPPSGNSIVDELIKKHG